MEEFYAIIGARTSCFSFWDCLATASIFKIEQYDCFLGLKGIYTIICVGTLVQGVRGDKLVMRHYFRNVTTSAILSLLMLQSATAHDPQGTASASTQSAIVTFALFLVFVGGLYRFTKTKLNESNKNTRILALITLVLSLVALSALIVYPGLFFIIIWLS